MPKIGGRTVSCKLLPVVSYTRCLGVGCGAWFRFSGGEALVRVGSARLVLSKLLFQATDALALSRTKDCRSD
jgi:hypothetical protein